jgi:hypothetical protein
MQHYWQKYQRIATTDSQARSSWPRITTLGENRPPQNWITALFEGYVLPFMANSIKAKAPKQPPCRSALALDVLRFRYCGAAMACVKSLSL